MSIHEEMHMAAFVLGKLEDPREAVKDSRGHISGATLLQVCVPRAAYARGHRDFLTPESGGAATTGPRESKVLRP
jgi:hypothetical protein